MLRSNMREAWILSDEITREKEMIQNLLKKLDAGWTIEQTIHFGDNALLILQKD